MGKVHFLQAASAVALLTSGAIAEAQSTPPADQQAAEIIVTGTRIARQDYVAQSPIMTQTAAAVENSGVPTVDAFLIQMPQFAPGSGGFSNNSGGGLGIGQATLNLRGLGAVRTLVLLDGRRLQPGNADSTIDINTIPASAIQGVEVITGGASATYGSDAIAGVVNFKLRRNFTGYEVSAQFGIGERGDAPTKQMSFIAGTAFAGDRGHVILAGEYADRQPIGYRDRAFSTPTGNIASQTANGYYAPAGTNLPTQAAVNTVFGTYGIASGTVLRTQNFGVNNDATLFRSNGGLAGINFRGNGDPCMVNAGSNFGYDGNCTNNLQNGLKRWAGLLRAEYRISDSGKLFAQVNYAHSKARGQGSHAQATPFGQAGLTIPMTNPFIPADLRTLLLSRSDPSASFTYVKRMNQAGPRTFTSTTDTVQAVIGMEGKVLRDWDYEIYGSLGEMKAADRSVSGNVSISAIQQLLSAPDGGKSLCTGGFNIFGDNPLSASCLQYVTRFPVTYTTVRQQEIAGSLTGKLFTLPAGDVKAAFSANYRHNSYRTNPDPLLIAGDIPAVAAIQPTNGSQSVGEGAVELLIPLLADVPLVQSLNLTPGYRYSHYNRTGGISTWKINFDWRVIDSVMLRGGYQKAVRTPNIGELYLLPGGIIANIGSPPANGDPCDIASNFRAVANTNAGQVRALCLAQGIPSAIIDSYKQGNVGNPSVTQGNPNLTPETARSWTVGMVFQPKFLGPVFNRFNISVDYYNLDIQNTIATLGAQISLNKCFNADGSNPTYSIGNTYCQLLQRNAVNGQFSNLVQPLMNLGGYKTDGVDVQADWTVPLGRKLGSLNLSGTANWVTHFRIQQLPGTAFQDYAGTIGNGVFPNFKFSGSATWDVGPVQLGARFRHYSSFRDSSVVTNPASTTPGPRAIDYVDLFSRIKVADRFELRMGVTNVGDITPPQVGSIVGFTNQGVYDVIGRAYYVGMKTRF
jgi:outer membrane receptor protein involved in Fe transport